VELQDAKVTLRDRQRAVLAEKTWPAPGGCPADVSGVDLGGPVHHPRGTNAHPYHPIRDWLTAWMTAYSRM
jgi:hypothetical protein